jgi:hypothetical protein
LGSILIRDGAVAYITTKNNLESFDVLAPTKNTNTPSCFILLGPKTNLNLTTKTTYSANGIIKFLEGNNYTFSPQTERYFNTTSTDGLLINVYNPTKASSCYIKHTSNGEDWKTPIDGYISIEENSVYNDDDFYYSKGLETFSILLVVIFCIVVVVVAFLFIYCICCKKSKRAEGLYDEPPAYGAPPPAYGAPQPAYGAPPSSAYGAPPSSAYGAPPSPAYGAPPQYENQPPQYYQPTSNPYY